MRLQIEPGSIDRFTLDDYFTAVYRRKWIILFMTACTVGFATVASKMITPRYEAKTVFYVPSDAGTSSKTGDAVDAPRLPSGVIEHAKAYVGILQGKDAAVAVHQQFPQKSKEDLGRDVDFSATRGGLVEVYVRDKDPKLAADLANAYFAYFNNFHESRSEASAAASLEKVNERLRGVEANLIMAREKKRDFLQQHNIASLAMAIAEYEQQRADCRQNLEKAATDMKDAERRIASFTSQLKGESEAYASGAITNNNTYSVLSDRITTLQLELAAKTSRLGPNHPEVIDLAERMNRARQLNIDESQTTATNGAKSPESTFEFLRRNVAQAQADYDAAAGRQQKLAEQLESLGKQISALPELEITIQKLDDDITQLAKAKADLEASRNSITEPTLHLRKAALAVETAYPPANPIFPILWLNIGTAMVMGVMMGVIYALFLEHLESSRRIKRVLPFAGLRVQLQSITP